jgi:hypothetical protein
MSKYGSGMQQQKFEIISGQTILLVQNSEQYHQNNLHTALTRLHSSTVQQMMLLLMNRFQELTKLASIMLDLQLQAQLVQFNGIVEQRKVKTGI